MDVSPGVEPHTRPLAAGAGASAELVRQPLAYDYLVLSDVHLGSDLVPHVRPWARKSWLSAAPEIDERLTGLLSHYGQQARHKERPLCLIVAGDFLDLVGVSLSADPRAAKAAPTREEQLYGLGSAHDHVVQKVQAIAARHQRAFAAFSAFIAAGNRLIVVRGNHDVELHWQPRPEREPGRRAALGARGVFADGLLYSLLLRWDVRFGPLPLLGSRGEGADAGMTGMLPETV